ncbi:uncharacterized protein LOC118425622 isoform X1 [Branchiostoma floridae]|uniref:Uncharacterized protein LOC118425622 isoform X1 n=1 Tax=Branchiostoma floridae TaxID=7739 RepID=A0A9J7N5M6_BRAFL|nr:uncharacterized protein LOC118425622 isoform X1 [Branchiostoma floridae]
MSVSARASISPFRALLQRLSGQVSGQELADMKHLLRDHVSERRREEARSCLDLWEHLEKAGLLTDGRTDLLTDLLDKLDRQDLVRLVEEYQTKREAALGCGKITPPPTQCESTLSPIWTQSTGTSAPIQCQSSLPPVQCQSSLPPVQCQSSLHPVQCQSSPPPVQSTQQTCAHEGHVYTQPPVQEEGKSFHQPFSVQSESQTLSCQTLFNGLPTTAAADGPADGRTDQRESVPNVANHPVGDHRQRAVRIKEQRVSPKAQNYMETGGYRVGIVGGRHYEIDGEEFVEMDHGSSYRIRLTNSHLSSCEAQLDIDGKDVGTWRLEPGQQVELERPEEEQMCFTFFSTRLAPPDSGIRRGEEENGLVQVTFTPEKMREERTKVKDPYRGGDQVAGDDTSSSDSSSDDEDEPFRSDTPLNWSSGATALQGVSRQEFEQVEAEMEKDEEKRVIMILRLVARTDAPTVQVSSAPVKPLMSKRPRAIPD